jgi:hypothetical protein
VKNTNPKEISGVYFIRYIDSVPILYHIPSGSDTLEQIDMQQSANLAKYTSGKKYCSYISDVDIK